MITVEKLWNIFGPTAKILTRLYPIQKNIDLHTKCLEPSIK